MGAVCSAEVVRENGEEEVEEGMQNEEENGNVDRNAGEGTSELRIDNAEGRMHINVPNLATPTPERGSRQVNLRGPFLLRAGGMAVAVMNALGSGMTTKLHSAGGFVSGMVSKGNKLSILAFEVVNTITRGTILFHSLSEENVWYLKKEILQSKGLELFVSTDIEELLSIVEADKREEFNAFSQEVVRFGNMCKDPQWHNLDRYFSRLDLDAVNLKELKVEVEKIMQEFTDLTKRTAELYREILDYERSVREYQKKIKEMESSTTPPKEESQETTTKTQIELKQQRKLLKSLKKKSLWSSNMEEIVDKLVDIATYILLAMREVLGNNVISVAKDGKRPQTLGEAGLAMHYAGIIERINVIAIRPATIDPNMREGLYEALPSNIKSGLSSKVQSLAVRKELSYNKSKAEVEKKLHWLVPLAMNTVKASKGFRGIVDWASKGRDFSNEMKARESFLIRLQTLHYADKQKVDDYIIDVLAYLQHLINLMRSRHSTVVQLPLRFHHVPKALDLQSNMIKFVSGETSKKSMGTEVTEEDMKLMEKVVAKRRNPGISKSENFGMPEKKEAKDLHRARSAGSSPVKELVHTDALKMEHQNVLDVLDGLAY